MSSILYLLSHFRQKHPRVHFTIYTANADDIKERIEKGLLDMGLLMEPVDISRYEFARMPVKERWAVMVREDSPLAKKEFVTPRDLADIPLIFVYRETVKQELAGWFGKYYDNIETAVSYNLVRNAVSMVQNGVGAAICYVLDNEYKGVKTIPLSPPLEAGAERAAVRPGLTGPHKEEFPIDFPFAGCAGLLAGGRQPGRLCPDGL